MLTLKEVRIEPGSLIADQISFDQRSNSISFNGEEIESFTSSKMVKIKITLVNSFGENPYSQMVIVFPTVDSTSPDSPASDVPDTDEPTHEQPSEETTNTAEVEGNDDSTASEDGQIPSIDSVIEIRPG